MQRNAGDSKTTWELTNPFTFAQLLEYWVQQFCDKCGRGNLVCVYGKIIAWSDLLMNKQWTMSGAPHTSSVISPRNKFHQLYDCWNGTFCGDCGRGGFTLPSPPDSKESPLHPRQSQTTPGIQTTSSSTLHRILRDWVLCGCVGCGRAGNMQLRFETEKPIPLELVMAACRGTRCQICGRGMLSSQNIHPFNFSILTPPSQVQTHKQLESQTHKSTGLVATYLQQKRKR